MDECLVGLSTNVNNATSQLGLQDLSDQQRQLGLNNQQNIQKSTTQQGLTRIHESAGHQSTGLPGQTNLNDLTNQIWRPGDRGFHFISTKSDLFLVTLYAKMVMPDLQRYA